MDKKISETYIMETRKDRESDSFGDATYFKLRTDRKYVFAYNEKLEHFEITEVEATKGTLFADNSRYIKAFTENELTEYKAKIRAEVIEECYTKAKTMMDELSYQNVGRKNGKMHRIYCIQALDFLRQVVELLKEQKNG